MILTGLAKRAFGMFMIYNFKIADWETLDKMNEVFKNALMMEWFDSVGIFIELSGIWYQGSEPEFNYNIQEKGTLNGINGHIFYSRQEATTAAITKANEIYNERYGK